MQKNNILKNFYVIEGIDGSGKSTIVNKLREENLKSLFITYEPSNSSLGKIIRNILKLKVKNIVSSETLAYLFAIDRTLHVSEIQKYLKSGSNVISDRYLFSSIVYQNGIANKLNSHFPLPAVVFFLNTAIKTIEERLEKREVLDFFEKREYLNILQEKYKRVLSKFEGKTQVIILESNNLEDIKNNLKTIKSYINLK